MTARVAHHRGAFTLIEILMTTVMAAVLLGGSGACWAPTHGFLKRGESKAEQAQLVRALLKQMADDLHAAMQDPVPGHPPQPRGPVAVRRFGLFGTETELRFDVLQITPFAGQPDAGLERGMPQARAALRAPELRTVYYRFDPPDAVRGPILRLPAGFEPPRTRFRNTFPGRRRGTLRFEPADGTATLSGSPGDRPDELLVVDPNDDSVMLAPEVIDCRFRYFDGTSWSSQWNSLQKKSLPVAVEVTLQVGTLEERQEVFAAETADPMAGPQMPADTGLVVETHAYATHRLVIDVPGAPMHVAPRKERSTAVAKLKARAAPRSRPKPRPTPQARPEPVDLSDQWMRTER